MIPRFKPYFGKEELLAALKSDQLAVERFEAEFARAFEAKHALAFPYGRSALWALLKAMDIHDAEIIMPAYTCVVVAHAIVLSGNTPRFVDITPYDYNMDLDQVAEAITKKTKVIIATHLFGYPIDVDRLTEIVGEAENRLGQKIWVIQDCAHAFGAEWNGKMVCNTGDAAFFGLNISKMITSIFGGMITTNNDDLYEKLKIYRYAHFKKPGFGKTIRRLLYLMAIYLAFNQRIYRIVYCLQEKTSFINRFTKAYHLDNEIHFPPDHLDHMLPIEARVGLVQLKKYPAIIRNRRQAAVYYDKHLLNREGWSKLPIANGATYSHYVVRVPDRKKAMRELAKKGVQLGQLIEYSIPHMAAYKSFRGDAQIVNSLRYSAETVNFPIWGGEFVARKVDKLVKSMEGN